MILRYVVGTETVRRAPLTACGEFPLPLTHYASYVTSSHRLFPLSLSLSHTHTHTHTQTHTSTISCIAVICMNHTLQLSSAVSRRAVVVHVSTDETIILTEDLHLTSLPSWQTISEKTLSILATKQSFLNSVIHVTRR